MLRISSAAIVTCLVATLCGVGAGGCLYDPKHRCGTGEHIDEMYGLCVCDEGWVLDAPNGCHQCGPNEVPVAGQCVCKMGYTKPSPDKACEASAAGSACNATMSCKAPYDYCRMNAGAAAGYCTKSGCSTSKDCPSGFACDTSTTPATCKRPPVGQLKACKINDDCAGTEATWCEFTQLHACVVEGCKVDMAQSCHEGWTCCDVTHLGLPKTLCLPVQVCP